MLGMAAAIAMVSVAQMHGHDGGEGHHGRHGNPEDLDAYVARMEEPGRAEWQKPDQVVGALGLRRGEFVCDIGAGPGYFSLRIARAVGGTGGVYAVDVEPSILDALRQRVLGSGLRNVTPVLALEDDALLPPRACDLILIVDTYHHFPDGPAYLRRLTLALKRGGKIVNIDFHKRELPVGPPPEHKLTREQFLEQARVAGLALVEEHTFLPYQYFLVLQPKR